MLPFTILDICRSVQQVFCFCLFLFLFSTSASQYVAGLKGQEVTRKPPTPHSLPHTVAQTHGLVCRSVTRVVH